MIFIPGSWHLGTPFGAGEKKKTKKRKIRNSIPHTSPLPIAVIFPFLGRGENGSFSSGSRFLSPKEEVTGYGQSNKLNQSVLPPFFTFEEHPHPPSPQLLSVLLYINGF